MRDNYTRIAVILDRSGSMEPLREATVAGFNEFVREQKKIPGEVKLKLVKFDDQYEEVFDKNLKDVPELTQADFVPRGWTALLDAQGRTIIGLGAELAAQAEDQRPSRVIVMTWMSSTIFEKMNMDDAEENRPRLVKGKRGRGAKAAIKYADTVPNAAMRSFEEVCAANDDIGPMPTVAQVVNYAMTTGEQVSA